MKLRTTGVLVAMALGLSVVAAACGGGGSSSTTAPPPATTAPPPATTAASSGPADTSGAGETTAAEGNRIEAPGQCGSPDAQGQKATGTPIKIGGIETDIPGIAFGTILNGTKAFFDCVNDNGGIDGHPIQYIIVNDRADGNAAHSAAVKLWESDKVLGFAGSTSTAECEVNHKYYEQNGINEIVAGATPSCFATSNIAPTNQGPLYSVSTATWWAINKVHADKIVCARANNPGLAFQCQGAAVQAKAANIPYVEEKVDVPITDYASLVTRLAQEAGTSGAVVPGFTEDQLVQLFPAVEQQGLIDATHWYEGATGSSSNVMAALGSAWDGKYFAQSEYNPPETGQGPDTENYRAVSAKYIPKDALSNFGEFGYTAGLMMTEAMLKVVQDGQELNQANVNAAVRNLVNIPTDLLCKPWYFGDLNSHLPNNASYFTTPKDGKAALLQPDCVTDPLTDPIITQALLDEKTLGLPQLPDTPSEADLQAALQQFSSGS